MFQVVTKNKNKVQKFAFCFFWQFKWMEYLQISLLKLTFIDNMHTKDL